MNSAMGIIVEEEIEARINDRLRESSRRIDSLEMQLDGMSDAYHNREDAFDIMMHVAKGAMSSLDEQGILEFLLIKDPVIRKWWEENK